MRSMRGKFSIWFVIAVAALIAIASLVSYLALRSAIGELSKQGQSITPDEIRQESVSENAKSLAQIAHGDLLLYLKSSELAEILGGALEEVTATRPEFPYAIDDMRLSTNQQFLSKSDKNIHRTLGLPPIDLYHQERVR